MFMSEVVQEMIEVADKSIRDAVAKQDPAQIQSAFDAHRYFASSFGRDLALHALLKSEKSAQKKAQRKANKEAQKAPIRGSRTTSVA